MTRPTEAFIEQVRNDEDGPLTILSAVSLLLPVAILVDMVLDLAERLSGSMESTGGILASNRENLDLPPTDGKGSP